MSEQELRRLLTVAAEDVRPTHPASAGWERAGRVRRARRAAGGAALAVVLLSGGTALALGPAGPGAPVVSGTATPNRPTEAFRLTRPPAELAYPADPLARLTNPPSRALSTAPVRRALALYQPIDPESGAGGPIEVLGDDGIVRTLDTVTPAPTRDAGGNEAVPLKTGSLAPDGRTAAFAQSNEVIVVDLTTAQVRRLPLAGYLEHVVWSGNALLTGDDATTYLVDSVTGAARKVPVSAWDVVAPDPAAPSDTLVEVGGPTAAPVLRTVSTADGAVRAEHRVSGVEPLSEYRVEEFYGRGWQRGDQVARAGWISTSQIGGDEGVAVLDARTGALTHLLNLGREGRYKGCCGVQRWETDGAVVLRMQPGGLVRWRPETGEVTGIIRNLSGVVSLAG